MRVTEDADLIIGVDTHLHTHTAAICGARGRVVSQLQIPATTAGYVQVLACGLCVPRIPSMALTSRVARPAVRP